MAFDINAFREAHTPWSFTIGGRRFDARHVSAPTVQSFQRKLTAAGLDGRNVFAAYRWLLRHAFPWRFSYLLRGDPVKIVLALEPQARDAALSDFFECLLGTTRAGLQKPKTSGTRSPAPTRTRSA
jgi:hypothetical protein